LTRNERTNKVWERCCVVPQLDYFTYNLPELLCLFSLSLALSLACAFLLSLSSKHGRPYTGSSSSSSSGGGGGSSKGQPRTKLLPAPRCRVGTQREVEEKLPRGRSGQWDKIKKADGRRRTTPGTKHQRRGGVQLCYEGRFCCDAGIYGGEMNFVTKNSVETAN